MKKWTLVLILIELFKKLKIRVQKEKHYFQKKLKLAHSKFSRKNLLLTTCLKSDAR